MDNNNLLVIIILMFILVYMVKSMCGGRSVEGLACNRDTHPIKQGWGNVTSPTGNDYCKKCREMGYAVNPTSGNCEPCQGDNDGLGADYTCKQYSGYFKAEHIPDTSGLGHDYYEQSKKATDQSCTQHGWGKSGSDCDNILEESGNCMKKLSERGAKEEQQCSCWVGLSDGEKNSGFWVESSYLGGYGERKAPERYVQCNHNNI
jgi:hypothetical protein